MIDALADPGPSFPIVGRAKDSARKGRQRIALHSRKNAPANGGECGYVDGEEVGEEGGYIIGDFHLRPGQPIVGRAKHGLLTDACEKCSPDCGERCDTLRSIDLSQIYSFPAFSLVGRAEDDVTSSGEERIAMSEENVD